MSDSRSDRLVAGAGILAAVLFVAGFVLAGVDSASSDSTRAEVLATYSDDAVNGRQALGILLMALGGVSFLPFLSYLRGVVKRAAGDTSVLPGTAFAGGVLLVGGLIAGAVASGAVSAGAFFDSYRVDPDMAMIGAAAGWYLYGFAVMAGGVLIGATALAVRRSRLLPKWLTVVGYVIAVASVPAMLLGMWILVESVWIAIAAGVLARRGLAGQPGAVRMTGEATV